MDETVAAVLQCAHCKAVTPRPCDHVGPVDTAIYCDAICKRAAKRRRLKLCDGCRRWGDPTCRNRGGQLRLCDGCNAQLYWSCFRKDRDVDAYLAEQRFAEWGRLGTVYQCPVCDGWHHTSRLGDEQWQGDRLDAIMANLRREDSRLKDGSPRASYVANPEDGPKGADITTAVGAALIAAMAPPEPEPVERELPGVSVEITCARCSKAAVRLVPSPGSPPPKFCSAACKRAMNRAGRLQRMRAARLAAGIAVAS